jgi:N-methylhydantoinase A
VQVIGVDTGGTFTDFACDGRVLKVRSTPDDPARAVLEGIAALAPARARIVHRIVSMFCVS